MRLTMPPIKEQRCLEISLSKCFPSCPGSTRGVDSTGEFRSSLQALCFTGQLPFVPLPLVVTQVPEPLPGFQTPRSDMAH